MPRYFITTSDHVCVTDDEGVVVQDRARLRALMRNTLLAILHDEGMRTGVDEFSAEAHDEAGLCIMRAKASFVVADQ